jgi:3-deoxy-D-manno-octulosonic-acid transferase
MLLDREAAVRVNDGAELAAFVRRCLDEPAEYATAMGRRAADFVRQQQGAVERTWQQFAPLIPNGLESERFDGQIASKKKLATKSAA